MNGLLGSMFLALFLGISDVGNKVAIRLGSKILLKARVNWQWGPYTNAEAIIGLRLAKDLSSPVSEKVFPSVQAMDIELLAALALDRNLSSPEWAKGKIGQYVTAVKLTCRDPTDFYGYDLLSVVEQQMVEQEAYFRVNRFALAWMFIARCNQTAPSVAMDILTESPGQYKFGVDEASMILMATTCQREVEKTKKLNKAHKAARKYIISGLRKNESVYNVYSKSLAVQALTASEANKPALIKRTVKNISQEVMKQKEKLMKFPGAGSHILPALAGKSYVDAFLTPVTCNTTQGTGNGAVVVGPPASIDITVTDQIVKQTNDTWSVTYTAGQTLYHAMVILQDESTTFSFKSTATSFGESIRTINEVTANRTAFQYWEISEASSGRLRQGVSSTYPEDGQHFIFNLTTWN